MTDKITDAQIEEMLSQLATVGNRFYAEDDVLPTIWAAADMIAAFKVGRTQPVKTLREALDECIAEMQFARLFITSRQRMHPDGVKDYDDLVAKLISIIPPQPLPSTPEQEDESP